MSRLGKFIRRPSQDRRLLLAAFVWLLWARLLVWLTPFRWVAPALGQKMNTTSSERLTTADDALVLRVSWAIKQVAENFPLRLVCLPQAMAAKWLLRRRGIESTLYLGVRDDPENSGKVLAHAWLRCGPRIITGRNGHADYAVVAMFGSNVP